MKARWSHKAKPIYAVIAPINIPPPASLGIKPCFITVSHIKPLPTVEYLQMYKVAKGLRILTVGVLLQYGKKIDQVQFQFLLRAAGGQQLGP